MSKHNLRRGIAGVLLSAGALTALSTGSAFATSGATGVTGVTGPTGATGSRFNTAKVQLELKLSERVTSLAHLASDVSGSMNVLTPAHEALLSARIGTEQTDINGLVTKVPNDTTWADLNSDSHAMYSDNRVYAVMTPQVFETISLDAAAAQFVTLAANESTLATEVASIGVGNPGYQNAFNHDNNYVNRVGHWSTTLSNLVTVILAQQPSDYPHDQHFFARANQTILQGNVAIAYANYDASVIALATGGYTGS